MSVNPIPDSIILSISLQTQNVGNIDTSVNVEPIYFIMTE